MKTVWVNVKCLPKCADPDGAAGVWQVSLTDELLPGYAAGAALDVFHRQVPISVLDDFEISTIEPNTHQEIYEAEDYVQGSVCEGEVVYLRQELPSAGPTLDA